MTCKLNKMKKVFILCFVAILLCLLLPSQKSYGDSVWKSGYGMQPVEIQYCIGKEGEIYTGTIECCVEQNHTMCEYSAQNDLCVS